MKRRQPKTAEENKLYIEEEWARINADKALCRRLMYSIPKRMEAVIRIGGKQLRKTDYE